MAILIIFSILIVIVTFIDTYYTVMLKIYSNTDDIIFPSSIIGINNSSIRVNDYLPQRSNQATNINNLNLFQPNPPQQVIRTAIPITQNEFSRSQNQAYRVNPSTVSSIPKTINYPN